MKRSMMKHQPMSRVIGWVGLGILVGCSPIPQGSDSGEMVRANAEPQPIDPSATQSDAQPPTTVYAVHPQILAIQIDVGETVHGQQIPYEPDPSDQIFQPGGFDGDWVKRQGQVLGALIGSDQRILYTLDQLAGASFDPTWIDQRRNYQIMSRDDPNYAEGQRPRSVFRKTKPTDKTQTGPHQVQWPLRHVLYLKLPHDLQPGSHYHVRFPNGRLADLDFHYQPQANHSEAVHVSQLGFRPDDPVKVGFLSTWMGNGGGLSYPDGLTFWLIDHETDQPVFEGKTILSKATNDPEDTNDRNYTLTDVYLLDFSTFDQPGQYRACVEQIGCSFDFPIQSNAWQSAYVTSVRGLYHQRSGIELGPPYTNVIRPRPFHPDDGVVVYQSTVPLMDTRNGLSAKGPEANNFDRLVSGQTDQMVPDAWGGYFDAGDWDRRIQHLEVARLLLELAELFPDHAGGFVDLDLNIPESENDIPDLVDEALWGIDFFRRLQTSDGGIRGGIESSAHPRYGETSWQESLTVLAYAPDIWSSYIYASVSARAAAWLQPRFPDRALVYQESALQAMEYAEAELTHHQGEPFHHSIPDHRNLAALELFRLTGESRWHELFLSTTVFTDPSREVYEWKHHQHRDAAFLYARLDHPEIDPEVQANAIQALIREADVVAEFGQGTAFKWTKYHPGEPVGWGGSLGSPKAISLLRAYAVTDQENYLEAAILATQFAAGANPDNLVYTTGLGQRSPQNPLVVDQRVMGHDPPPGITVYGPLDLVRFSNFWTVDWLREVTFPDPVEWPTSEAYFDVYFFPPVTEFTVMQTIGPTAYTWGYLAARD